MNDTGNNNQEPTEGVRLVGRREAEAAIQAGHAISRNTLPKPPVVIGERQALDIRDEIVVDADPEQISEDQMAFPEDEDDAASEKTTPPTKLPHWTEPPTVVDEEVAEPEETAADKRSFSSLGEASGLAEASNNTDQNKDIDFDELDDDPFDVISPSPFRAGKLDAPAFGVTTSTESVEEPAAPHEGHTSTAAGMLKSSSLTQRLGTGIVFGIVAAAAFAAGPKFVLALCSVTVLLAAMEYFDAVRRVGYRPPVALGLLSVAGAMLGVYARGEAAIPLVLALVLVFTFLWYLVGVQEQSPTANTAVTLLGIVWTGIFGSYAALLLREPGHHGVAFILGGVLCVIAYDTAAYVGGTLIGKHILAPKVSPGKTWEGLACATVASIVVGGLVVQAIHPWSIGGGLLLGLVVAIVAPIGDLAESMVKRDLGLKDMGRILPGHGGLFDRFDAMLFVLPATYYLVRMLNLA